MARPCIDDLRSLDGPEPLDPRIWDQRYRNGLLACAQRYREMWNAWCKTGPSSLGPAMWKQVQGLGQFVDLFEHHIHEDPYPIPKLRGWLGSIQGKLHMLGITTDEAEREFTRPLFRPLDFPE